jgi:hypothetical protein
VERARALGLDAVAVPLFAVTPVAWDAPEAARFDGVLLTSANAVRHSGDAIERLRGLKVYAVGEATAESAREAGFEIAATGDADAAGLLGSIAPDLRLLHLCGADRRGIGDASQAITPVVVYRADAIDTPMLGGLAGQVAAAAPTMISARPIRSRALQFNGLREAGAVISRPDCRTAARRGPAEQSRSGQQPFQSAPTRYRPPRQRKR